MNVSDRYNVHNIEPMGDFETLGGSRLTRSISIVYVVLSMRALPGKSAATKRPESPILLFLWVEATEVTPLC